MLVVLLVLLRRIGHAVRIASFGDDAAAAVVRGGHQPRIARAPEFAPCFEPFGIDRQPLLGDDLFEVGFEIAARIPFDGYGAHFRSVALLAQRVLIRLGQRHPVGDVGVVIAREPPLFEREAHPFLVPAFGIARRAVPAAQGSFGLQKGHFGGIHPHERRRIIDRHIRVEKRFGGNADSRTQPDIAVPNSAREGRKGEVFGPPGVFVTVHVGGDVGRNARVPAVVVVHHHPERVVLGRNLCIVRIRFDHAAVLSGKSFLYDPFGFVRRRIADTHGHAQLERIGEPHPFRQVARIDLVRGGLDGLGRMVPQHGQRTVQLLEQPFIDGLLRIVG